MFKSVTFVGNGFEVQFDGVKTVKIIPPQKKTNVCGLCGNADGVLDEKDFLKGPDECHNLQGPTPKYSVVSTVYNFNTSLIKAQISD